MVAGSLAAGAQNGIVYSRDRGGIIDMVGAIAELARGSLSGALVNRRVIGGCRRTTTVGAFCRWASVGSSKKWKNKSQRKSGSRLHQTAMRKTVPVKDGITTAGASAASPVSSGPSAYFLGVLGL